MGKRRFASLAITLSSLIVFIISNGNRALAQDDPSTVDDPPSRYLYPSYHVGAGAFASFFNTDVRLDSDTFGSGTPINLEDDLGFDTKKFDFRAAGYVRLGRRHRIDFGYFGLSRRSDALLSEEIRFGNGLFSADTEVTANFETRFVGAGYRYSFLAKRKVEVAASLGLSALFLEAGMDAGVSSILSIPLPSSARVPVVRKTSVYPLPTLGFDVAYEPVSRLILRGRAGGVYSPGISGVTASVADWSVSTEYYFLRNVGLGAGYNWASLRVDDYGSFPLEARYRYSGLLLYGVFSM
jgi:hypothetical protein